MDGCGAPKLIKLTDSDLFEHVPSSPVPPLPQPIAANANFIGPSGLVLNEPLSRNQFKVDFVLLILFNTVYAFIIKLGRRR